MDVLYANCAGLDIHKDTVVACSRRMIDGKVMREVRTFKTTTGELLALSEWLGSLGATHIVMEATGVYWKPVWNILSDGDFELILANAAHVKNVPGRKTDVNDATWLADLLAHGLIRASFVPDTRTQELRGLLRTRKQLTRERTSHIQRLQKTLEEANIKLNSVISDVIGPSGRAMIEALIAGETDPLRLASLASSRIKGSPAALAEALRGRVTRHHRFLLRLHLQQIDALDRAIAEIDKEVEANLAPFRELIPVLTSIPGIGELAARILLAEIGADMSRFPTAGHLISWAGLCPQNDESRGEAAFHSHPQGGALAEDHSHPMRLGGGPQNGQLSGGSVPSSPSATRAKKSCRSRCSFHPDRRLPHDRRRHILPRPRRRSLRAPRQTKPDQTPRRQNPKPRL